MFRKLALAADVSIVKSFLGLGRSTKRSVVPVSMSTWPLGFRNVENEMSNFMKIFDDMALLPTKMMSHSPLTPLLDIKETKDKFEYIVDAPGVKKEDVKVEVRDQVLKIEMQRNIEKDVDTDEFHRVERYSGTMRRMIPLPNNVKDDDITATCVDGVLHVNVPKLPGMEEQTEMVKQIEVK